MKDPLSSSFECCSFAILWFLPVGILHADLDFMLTRVGRPVVQKS
jgi:hypothetical protein